MGTTRVMQNQDDELLKHTKYIAGSTHIATENRGLRSVVFSGYSGCHRHQHKKKVDHQDFITEILLKVAIVTPINQFYIKSL